MNINKIRLSFITMLSILCAFSFLPYANAAQYSPPWSHQQFVDDTYKFGWADSWVDGMGYNGHSSQNLSAYSAWTSWKSDSIFAFSGHAGPGVIRFEPASGWSYIYGKGGTNNGTNYYINNFGSSDITDNLVALFLGCQTAVDSSSQGHLLYEARAKGADIAIGWLGNIGVDAESVFGIGFFRGAKLYNYKVDDPLLYNTGTDTDLMQYAYGYMANNSEYPDTDMQNWNTLGWNGQRLKPARYGTP